MKSNSELFDELITKACEVYAERMYRQDLEKEKMEKKKNKRLRKNKKD